MKKYSSTTKASLRQISRNERLKVTLWVAVAVVLVLVLLPRLVSVTASMVLMPVVMVENWLQESDTTLAVYLRDRNELLVKQEELEQSLAELQQTDYTTVVLSAENELLRGLLGQATTSTRIGAGVVGRPTNLPYDVLVIDKGELDGVLKDAPVYLGRDQVIGVVAEVYGHSAVVALVTTPGLASTVYIYGPNIYTTAEGIGGGVLRVNVPQGILLEEGNLVVIPSFASGVYGTVTLVESVPTKPEQFGYVTIETPLSSLRYVSVGSQPIQPISFEAEKDIVDKIRLDLTTVPVPAGVLVDVNPATTTATSTGVISDQL